MNITFISTVHTEMGKCNADELCEIIEKIKPEVIFLEALDDTYSDYEKSIFTSFGVYHKKLEIHAMQKYSGTTTFIYVHLLEKEMSEAFVRKQAIACEHYELQMLFDNFNALAQEKGFEYLNSVDSMLLLEEMRMLERRLLNDSELINTADEDIDTYENTMLRNIYSYCKSREFNTAIFMCGSGHRKSIIEKIEKYKAQEETNINWIIFGSISEQN